MKIQVIQAAEAQELIAQLDRDLQSLYPAVNNYLDSVDVLSQDNVYMVGAFAEDILCAMGAVKVFADYGEMKRVYVRPDYRRKGLAKAIVRELENHLIELGIKECKLETGIYQTEAIGLYRRLGYQKCDRFGDYNDDPLNVYMSKTLAVS